MGISTSRLFDRRAYGGKIDDEYRMRSPSAASRSRTRGWRTATGPMPGMISRSGRWPWRTPRCWPVAVLRSAWVARNSATSASTAWVSSARAPLRRISVRESVKVPGWASLITLLSDTAYHSFIGEVEALNTTTIRRLTLSCRHQHPAIALRRSRWLLSTTAELTIRGGGMPYSNLALDADRENGPAARSFAADAHDCIMVRIKRSYRIQVCGTKSAPMASSPRILNRQTGTVRRRSYPLSQFIIAPRAQASRRCETQPPLS